MVETKRESAVSEIIGTILIVALTVVLAAIIVTYALSMGSSIPTPHNIALTASQIDQNTIVVIYHGGPDQDRVTSLNITWPSGVIQQVNAPRVGDTYRAANPGNVTSGNDRILITGHFDKLVNVIVLDTTV